MAIDNCPLTFQELDQIRKSFIYTAQYATRVEYPRAILKEPTTSKRETPTTPKVTSDANAQSGDQQPTYILFNPEAAAIALLRRSTLLLDSHQRGRAKHRLRHDAEIVQVHADFMDDLSPTDVITFPLNLR